MTANLDLLLSQLDMPPLDRRLDQLEPLVWARIEHLRSGSARSDVWGWRAALTAAMLAIGVLAGGALAARPAQEMSPFALGAALAPSTLLELRS